MVIRRLGFVSSLLFAAALSSAQGYAPFADRVPDRLIVKFKSGPKAFLKEAGRGQVHVVTSTDGGITVLGGAGIEQWQSSISRRKDVIYAEPDYIVRAASSNDPYSPDLYSHSLFDLDHAWAISRGSSAVTVAVIDTGVDLNHPDLIDRLADGYDFVDRDSLAMDGHGHGTHCAGIVGATADNNIGVAGVAPLTTIVPVRVLGNDGSGSVSTVIEGIDYAVAHGAKVLSLSLGTSSPSQAMTDAVARAIASGATVFAAAGNAGTSDRTYPAADGLCIAVASTDSAKARSSFSNFGSWVQVAAPGSNILSTGLGGTYVRMSGTSMATPHAAGVAALLYANLGSEASSQVIKERLTQTAEPIGPFVSSGFINPVAALRPTAFTFTGSIQSLDEIRGGKRLPITVMIDRDAPSDGLQFQLQSSDPAIVKLPASLTIGRGRRSATVYANVASVAADSPFRITATTNGQTLQKYSVVSGAYLEAVQTRSSVTSGSNIRLLLRFRSTLPNSGLQVGMSSSDPIGVPVPSSITITGRKQWATITLPTTRVTESHPVTLTLTVNGRQVSVQTQLR